MKPCWAAPLNKLENSTPVTAAVNTAGSHEFHLFLILCAEATAMLVLVTIILQDDAVHQPFLQKTKWYFFYLHFLSFLELHKYLLNQQTWCV